MVQAVAKADNESGNDSGGESKATQLMNSVGLGAFADQLKDLQLSACPNP